jgi:hypothetical protein
VKSRSYLASHTAVLLTFYYFIPLLSNKGELQPLKLNVWSKNTLELALRETRSLLITRNVTLKDTFWKMEPNGFNISTKGEETTWQGRLVYCCHARLVFRTRSVRTLSAEWGFLLTLSPLSGCRDDTWVKRRPLLNPVHQQYNRWAVSRPDDSGVK